MASNFITTLAGIPLTRTTREQLKQFAKAEGVPEEVAAGLVIERYMQEKGEIAIRIAEAKLNAEEHRG